MFTEVAIKNTWKLSLEASMATEMGPMVATAAWRSGSLLDGISL